MTNSTGIELVVDGESVVVEDATGTLLGLLRDQLRIVEVKDGCSPQGQCGCCTVLVDGQPRVACVTPVRRVAGRSVTTAAGLSPERRQRWARAFTDAGASQCGFCTPGIIVRLDALDTKLGPAVSGSVGSGSVGSGSAGSGPVTSIRLESAQPGATAGATAGAISAASGEESEVEGRAAGGRPEGAMVDQALLAHLCRCTGWQTIVEAWERFRSDADPTPDGAGGTETGVVVNIGVDRRPDQAARRAELEGGAPQRVGPEVAFGHGGFSVDEAPADALVAVSNGQGGWSVGQTLAEARALMGKVQGRRTTADHQWPLAVPEGDWGARLRTTWVEPAYLETDASWCLPGGEPSTVVANGGAFGAKAESPVRAAARAMADEHGRPVVALASREDATRWGAKRPPVAGGANADGSGLLRVVATPGIAEAVASIAPGLLVEQVQAPGPPTSGAVRAAGWAEAVALLAGARGSLTPVTAPNGAVAEAEVIDGVIRAHVRCGALLDEVVLRSYCIGAAHMAWSLVTSEALTVDSDGVVHDLTIRSFGVARAVDTPRIEISLDPADQGEPVNGSDAVFAAVAAATWLSFGCRQDWPVGVQR